MVFLSRRVQAFENVFGAAAALESEERSTVSPGTLYRASIPVRSAASVAARIDEWGRSADDADGVVEEAVVVSIARDWDWGSVGVESVRRTSVNCWGLVYMWAAGNRERSAGCTCLGRISFVRVRHASS